MGRYFRKPHKTWKRELAGLMFVFLCYLAVSENYTALEMMNVPCMTFIGLAFGLDWKSRQEDKQRNGTDASTT